MAQAGHWVVWGSVLIRKASTCIGWAEQAPSRQPAPHPRSRTHPAGLLSGVRPCQGESQSSQQAACGHRLGAAADRSSLGHPWARTGALPARLPIWEDWGLVWEAVFRAQSCAFLRGHSFAPASSTVGLSASLLSEASVRLRKAPPAARPHEKASVPFPRPRNHCWETGITLSASCMWVCCTRGVGALPSCLSQYHFAPVTGEIVCSSWSLPYLLRFPSFPEEGSAALQQDGVSVLCSAWNFNFPAGL